MQDDKATLESLEQELCKARVELQQIKMACEKLRTKRERIQVLWIFYNCDKNIKRSSLLTSQTCLSFQTTMNVQALPLLDDMEAYRDEGKAAQKRLKGLKHQYETLVNHIHEMQRAIQDHSSSCFIDSSLSDSPTKSLRWGASSNVHVKRPILRA